MIKRKIMRKKKKMMKAKNLIVKEKSSHIRAKKKEVEKDTKSIIIQKRVEKHISLSLSIYRLLTFGTNEIEKIY